MRPHFFFLVLSTWILYGNSYSQNAYWLRNAGGVTTDVATGVSSDAVGNAYTTGYFTTAAVFGTSTVNSSGVTDVFVTKTDSDGYFQWAVQAGGSGSDRALSIKTDDAGNSFVTGFFYGTAIFGTDTIVSSGAQDVFIAKCNSQGQFVWVTKAGGSEADIANAIDLDDDGNVVITGEFSGEATFGSQSLESQNGSVDVFTAKLNSIGEFVWAKKGSAHATDRGIDVACDASGNVYVTGQFTDTITFDNTHFNNTYNAVFLVKYNSSGTEQWFRRMGAGSMNVVKGLEVDEGNNPIVAGDFNGNMIFFGTPNTTLSHDYPNRMFLAKYDSNGSLLWTKAEGSESEITVRDLCFGINNDPTMIGGFKCRFDSYSDQYGEGIFNSVGNWDVFVSQYNSGGSWQWSRSFGGKQDDIGNGITVDSDGEPIAVGSFSGHIYIPEPNDFLLHDTYSVSSPLVYCNDNEYGEYRGLSAEGNTDAFLARIFEPNREPFDYYRRSGTGCDRPFVGVCIGGYSCPDTLTFCGSGFLSINSNTYGVGPSFTYLWSTGNTGAGTGAGVSGLYSVTQTTSDGCFTSEDSVYVHLNEMPEQPLISDNAGVNTNASSPLPIVLCAPDSVLLTGSGYQNNSHQWTGPVGSNSDHVWATESGNYSFSHTDENGCVAGRTVNVEVDSLFTPFTPWMTCLTDTDGNDSLAFCLGEEFSMLVFDTLSDPFGETTCLEDASVSWTVTPSTIGYAGSTACTVQNQFSPQETGEYLIEATIMRENHCDTDVVSISRSVYVEVYPVPDLGGLDIDIIGATHLCPGDSILLVATEAANYNWNGPGIEGSEVGSDSIWIDQQGNYSVSTDTSETNEFGCTTSISAQASVFVQIQSQPEVVMQPGNGVICPNDSVQIICNGFGQFEWQGSSGSIGNNEAAISVNTPGTYYCIRTDQYGCELVSNSVEVEQYATPFILTSGEPILCPDESITLNAVSNPGSIISWQPPLGGNLPQQTVSQAGIYRCIVSSCGIETEAEVEVTVSNVVAAISIDGAPTACEGDSVVLKANSGQDFYEWNPEGGSTDCLVVFETGTYTLTTYDANGCNAQSEPVTVTIVENNVQTPLVNDTAICPGGYATLNALANGIVLWYDSYEAEESVFQGASFTTENLHSNATYYVQQKSNYCLSEKAPVYVDMDDCEGIEVSTAFSPNGDGINDVFSFPQKGGTYFRCRIYNRWGKLVHQWNNQEEGWDGTVQSTGAKAKSGVYYYILDYRDYQEKTIEEAGFLHLFSGR